MGDSGKRSKMGSNSLFQPTPFVLATESVEEQRSKFTHPPPLPTAPPPLPSQAPQSSHISFEGHSSTESSISSISENNLPFSNLASYSLDEREDMADIAAPVSWIEPPINISSRKYSLHRPFSMTNDPLASRPHTAPPPSSSHTPSTPTSPPPIVADSPMLTLITPSKRIPQLSALQTREVEARFAPFSREVVLSQGLVRSWIARSQIAERRRRRDHRERVARELLSSENTYVENLDVLTDQIIRHLTWNAQQGTSTALLSLQDIPRCFANLESIAAFSHTLRDLIQERIDSWSPHQLLGDIIVRHAPYLRLYSVYCEKYQSCMAHIQQCTSTNPLFRQWLEQVLAVQGLDLPSLMITPVQRLPRYKLLLADILRLTDPEHPDHTSLSSAVAQVTVIADAVNKYMKQSDKNKRVVYLGFKLRGLGEDLVQPSRTLVLEEALSLRKNAAPNYFMLFNDLLVVVNEMDPEVETTLSVRLKIPLATARVKDITDTAYLINAFQLVGESKSYVVLCGSPEQKERWLAALETNIHKLRTTLHQRNSLAQLELTPEEQALRQASLLNPYGTHKLSKCAVRVDGSQIFVSGSKTFTLYFVTCITDFGYEFNMHKRYSDFVSLHNALRKRTPDTLPRLPPRYMTQRQNLSDEVRGERQVLLDQYLQDLVLHSELQSAPELLSFLTLSLLSPDMPISPRRGSVGAILQGVGGAKGDVREIEVVYSDDSVSKVRVAHDTYANEVLAQICTSDPSGSLSPLDYRLKAITASGSEFFEERDTVAFLDNFGSKRVRFERYALPATLPDSDAERMHLFKLSCRHVTSGLYRVTPSDLTALLSRQLLVEDSDSSLVTWGAGGEALSLVGYDGGGSHKALVRFSETLRQRLPQWALEVQNEVDWSYAVHEAMVNVLRECGGHRDVRCAIAQHAQILSRYSFHSFQLLHGLAVQQVSLELGVKYGAALGVGREIALGVNVDVVRLLAEGSDGILAAVAEIPLHCVEYTGSDLHSVTLEWLSDSGHVMTLKLQTQCGHRVVATVSWFGAYQMRAEQTQKLRAGRRRSSSQAAGGANSGWDAVGSDAAAQAVRRASVLSQTPKLPTSPASGGCDGQNGSVDSVADKTGEETARQRDLPPHPLAAPTHTRSESEVANEQESKDFASLLTAMQAWADGNLGQAGGKPKL